MSIKLKPIGINKNDKALSDEEKLKWRVKILQNYADTNEYAKLALKDGRCAREKLSKILDEDRAVFERWNEYSEKYNSA